MYTFKYRNKINIHLAYVFRTAREVKRTKYYKQPSPCLFLSVCLSVCLSVPISLPVPVCFTVCMVLSVCLSLLSLYLLVGWWVCLSIITSHGLQVIFAVFACGTWGHRHSQIQLQKTTWEIHDYNTNHEMSTCFKAPQNLSIIHKSHI